MSEEVSAAKNQGDNSEPLPPAVGAGDWFFSLLFLPVFWLCFLVAELLQRLAVPFGMRTHDRIQDLLNSSILAALRLILKVDYQVSQHGEIPEGSSLIVVSNHQSIFDVTILHTLFAKHRPRFIAKQELARGIPGVSFNLRRGKHALINRQSPAKAVQEIKRLGVRVANKEVAAVIFPEGTRARRGQLRPFRPAGLATLIGSAPDATIVPVAIDGSWKLSAYRCLPIPLGTRIRVTIAPAIRAKDYESAKTLAKELHEQISQAIGKIRRE